MTTAEPGIRLRPAEEGDARPLAELWAEAFPGEPRVAARLRALREGAGPYGGLERCWVAEHGGGMVGALRRFPLVMRLWGRPFPVEGLAAVAVAPEYRRRGVGRRMCVEALRLARDAGALLAALFPFRVDFYSRLGFALAGELHRFRFAAADLPPFPGHERVRPLSGEGSADRIADFYRSLLPRVHGLLDRTGAVWRDRLEGPVRALGVLGEAGALEGYMLVEGSPGRSPERAILRIQELLAEDLGAYQALLGWVSLQRDRWPRVRHDAVPGEHFHQILPNPRLPGLGAARGLWFPSAFLLRGPMLRVLDVAAAIEAAALPEGVVLPVEDGQLPGNSGSWVVGAGGVAERHPVPGGGGTGPSPVSIRLLTDLFITGKLPGQEGSPAGWHPALGLKDFRLLDAF